MCIYIYTYYYTNIHTYISVSVVVATCGLQQMLVWLRGPWLMCEQYVQTPRIHMNDVCFFYYVWYFATHFLYIIAVAGKELQDFVGGHQRANLGCCSGFASRTPGCFECFETEREGRKKVSTQV